MKVFLRCLLLFIGAWGSAAAQTPIDTTGGRFYRPVFPAVTVSLGVAYGSAVTAFGAPQTLLMDVYQPTGDAAAERPVLIFAHQGGFVGGSRSEQYMVDVCTRFARLGYVTASIDYRLLFFPFDTVNVAKAAIRGMQDMRAAVRFFRRDAATANLYRVSASRIVVGGASAGGFMALEVGYLDKDAEVPAYANIASLGGVEGASGNPGYSSAVLAVLNLSGALTRPEYIEAGNAPLYSIHGTADGTVPYLQGRVGAGLPPTYVFGSGRLNPYATTVGVPNTLRTLRGAPHIPQHGTTASQLAYADTTFRDIRDFLRPLLVPVTAPYPSLTINSSTDVAGGNYQNITVNSGQARLTGNVTVYGALAVRNLPGQAPGVLKTNCFVMDGPGSFDLQAGATLRICDAGGIAASGAAGAVRNTGARAFSNDAGYVYEGSGNQITGTGLPATVRELEVAVPAANAVTLSGSLGISQKFAPTSGVLSDGGVHSFTLLSGPAGTALATPGPGTLSGSFRVQRYLDPSLNPGLGYRHLALPFDSPTFAPVSGPAYAPNFNPAYNTSARPDLVTPFPTVFAYDQQRAITSPATSYSEFDKGWVVPPTVNVGVTSRRGLGYAVNLAAGQTLTLTGALSRNNQDVAVTLPAAATPTAGWHLVGNPFASALNWDNVPVPAGLSAAMYIFVSSSQYSGQYRTYVNGVGGAGSTVPLGQGFFVRSLAATPVTLTFPVGARLTDFAASNTATVQRLAADPRPRLRLTLAAAAAPAATDETFLYLEAGATAGSDPRFDADKLANPSGLNLSTVAAGQELAVNGLPLLGATVVVPLAVAVPQSGAYVLAAEDLVNFTPGTALTLTDALTGARVPLAAGTRYACTLVGRSAPGRFALELRPAIATAASAAQVLDAQLQVYPNPATGSLRVLLPRATGSPAAVGQAQLVNLLGQTVRRQPLAAPAGQALAAVLDVRGLAPGVYHLHLLVAGTPLVRRVVVQ